MSVQDREGTVAQHWKDSIVLYFHISIVRSVDVYGS